MDETAQYRIPVLEAFPWQESVLTRKQTTPPPNPEKGSRYLIPSQKDIINSAWIGLDHQIGWFDGFNWHYDPPYKGWVVYIEDEDIHLRFNGEEWILNTVENLDSTKYKEIFVSAFSDEKGIGTRTRPFKTINDAIELIHKTEDNDKYGYIINILPGKYLETILLEENTLHNIIFNGANKNSTVIDSCCESSLRSIIRNNCLETLVFRNISFKDPINLTGKIHKTKFGSELVFDNCDIEDIYLTNINHVKFTGNGKILGTFSMNNVASCKIGSEIEIFHKLNEKDFFIEVDPTVNLPFNFTDKTNLYLHTDLFRFIDWRLYNGGEIFVQSRSCQVGYDRETIYVPKNVIFEAINSQLIGKWQPNGTIVMDGSFLAGVFLAGEGHVDFRNQPASQIYNDSQVPGDTIKDALNYLFTNHSPGGNSSLGGTGGTGGTGAMGPPGPSGGSYEPGGSFDPGSILFDQVTKELFIKPTFVRT